jgi:hypothetical protein
MRRATYLLDVKNVCEPKETIYSTLKCLLQQTELIPSPSLYMLLKNLNINCSRQLKRMDPDPGQIGQEVTNCLCQTK